MDDLKGLKKLMRDLRIASVITTKKEARFLVDLYYQIQDYRIAAANQIRAIDKPVFFDAEGRKREPTQEELEQYEKEPHETLDWTLAVMEMFEENIKKVLDEYTDTEHMGQWAKQICGIGAVLSAGLLAHVEIEKISTVGQLWSYAGLSPQAKWEKGQKRPWNARLKVLAWKIGESFVKVQNNPRDFYGKIYAQRKALEAQKNERKEYAAQAAEILKSKNIGKNTEAYKWYSQGMLPPAHIHARAKRYAVKLFLAHYFEEAYRHHHGKEPPLPYPIQFLGHSHRINPPA